jgi:hypothetical protein
MSMDNPSKKYPNSPTTTPSEMPIYTPDFSIKGLSFDQLLQQRGVRFIHKKAIPCPNVLSTDTASHDPDCAFCSNSGIIYYDTKEIWGIFQGNALEKTFEAHGIWEEGNAVVTFPSTYIDGTQADFNTYDYLILPDFEARMWEQKEYEPTPNMAQKLRYPVAKVEFAISIVNNVEKKYVQGVDFNVDKDGNIAWVFGHEPGINPRNGRGIVVTWSYFAHPVYLVVQSLRELRITQELVNGQKQARRLPQQVLVKRDFMIGLGEKIVPGTEPISDRVFPR